ncbi:unnamed protein product [Paramecium pentaurelia]|uniref:ubiquitinyl hydrolase 1 n=1 Tax=Paramecium pentaurelia TaxID=43138 RepID=A0A8S1SKB5_9CILI|nr:unnamed protein product [Paramecium pentaurelia]
MEKCYKLIERQMYAEALASLTQILKREINNPQLETIYLIQHILSQSQRYKNLQIKILEIVKQEENEDEVDDDKYFNLVLDLINLLIDQNNIQQAKNWSKQLKKCVQGIQYNESLLYLIENLDNMLAYKQKNIDLKEQLQIYEELSELERKTKYFEQDGMPAYLIPTRWFNKWKSYVTDTAIELPNENLNIEKEIEVLENLFNVSSDLDIEEQITAPGPINGFTLIQAQSALELDPFGPKSYTNYILKENIREGADFILVGHKIYEYFKNIYGGFEIKRLIVEHSQTHQKYVDLVPRMIQFIILPNEEKHRGRLITANSSDLILDLCKKVNRILKLNNEVRWWKFNDFQSQEEFIKKLQKRELYKQVSAKVLDKTTMIDEINFTSSDLFICEIRYGRDWQISEIDKKQISSVKRKINISDVPQIMNDSRKGVTGLQNLGNTCFMNAALQCLSNTYELTEYMVSNEFYQHLNCENPLGTKGALATAYAELMKIMWYGNNSAVSAYDLKRVIGKFAPQFYGYGQQDSHEFLSYLLDGLHEDLNKVFNKPIVKEVEIIDETDFEASRIFWNNYILRNQSKIQQLMVGQYKSTLVCPNCHRVSKTFDPYMSLSLPIPSYTLIQLSLYFIYQNEKIPLKIQLNIKSDQDANYIGQELSKSLNIEKDQMNFILLKDHLIKERIKKKQNVKWIQEQEGQLFVYQIEKEFHQLSDDQIHIDFYYCNKTDRSNFNEQIITFPRQFVLQKQNKIIDIYFKIYQQFKHHLILIIQELADQLLNEGVNIQEYCQGAPQTLEEFINEIKQFKVELYKLVYNGKPMDYMSQDTLENYKQKILSIHVILNPLFGRSEIQNLKFQRCKDFNDEQNRQLRKGEYTLEDCLRSFAKEEVLGKGDEWYCNRCKQHVQATKQMEIYRAPQLLIIHLKRFRSANNRISSYGSFFYSNGSQKITTMVHFPKKLNLNPFVLSKVNDNDPIDYNYELYGVDNHFGGLGGGHYTACAYNQLINKWVDYNDSSARITSADVESEAAYVLFYRRTDSQKCSLGR